MRGFVVGAAVFVCGVARASGAPWGGPEARSTPEQRRGGIAFHYATPLSAHELEWLSRFDVLVTHEPLPREQVEALHRAGTRLVLYEWAVAYYASRATSWQRALPPSALLNETPLHGHLGAEDADAFYFDPAAREHTRDRAEEIAARLEAIGYDGVFLDATTSHSVHPDALKEFRRRHPSADYDKAFAKFLRHLRREVAVIVTNQGYRKADHVLPYVDRDVTESLITYPRDGRFVRRPWNDPDDRWNSIAYLMRKLIAPAARKYPRVHFTHINYIDAADPAGLQERMEEIVAIARLFGSDAYVAVPNLASGIETDLYFLDLGVSKPRVETSQGAYRFFERGLVAVNASVTPMRVGTMVVPPETAVIRKR